MIGKKFFIGQRVRYVKNPNSKNKTEFNGVITAILKTKVRITDKAGKSKTVDPFYVYKAR